MRRLLELWRSLFTGPEADVGARAAQPPRPVAWSSMALLLEELGEVAEEHSELFDTDVRERLWEAARRAVIRREPGYELPEELGMFSVEGNQAVRAVLAENFERLREVFDVFELDTEAKRRRSFLNPRVRSGEGGYHVDDFFGHP